MNLEGKTAVITGSSRGIGRGIALALAAQGCNIAVNYVRNRDAAQETADAINKMGVGAKIFKAHVGREEDIRQLVEGAATTFGGVDIFVGNAASGVLRPITDIDARDWDWTLNINARSILFGVQSALPFMKRSGWGRVVTITSIGSRRVYPAYSAVGVSKSAIEALTRYLAVELAPDGIIANCVSPGLVLTDALDFFDGKEAMIDHANSHTPAGRLTTPDDVGRVVAWLCSDMASMIVGQTIEVDGGYSLVMGV